MGSPLTLLHRYPGALQDPMTSLVGVVPGVTEERPGRRHQIRLTGDALSLRAVIFFKARCYISKTYISNLYRTKTRERHSFQPVVWCYGEVSHPIKKGLHWTQIKEFLIYVLAEVDGSSAKTISNYFTREFPLSSMVICLYISAPNTEGAPIHKHSPFSLLGCLIIPQAWEERGSHKTQTSVIAVHYMKSAGSLQISDCAAFLTETPSNPFKVS